MLVSIILPTVRTTTVGDAIEAILRQTVDDWEVVVVPQGDDAGLIELLEGYHRRDPRVRFVHADTMNLSNARNVGMAAATGDIFAFTDDDCEVAPDWVSTIIEQFDARPDIGFLGGEVVAPKSTQPWRISTCPAAHVIEGEWLPAREAAAPHGFYMIGANMVVRREVAERVGPFDVVLGAGARFACCEDQDFGFRAAALDVGFKTTPKLVVHHTTGRRYGFEQFVKHQRNYARGRGAWVQKLVMWEHPTGRQWAQPPTFRDHVRALRRPDKWLLELWAGRVKRAAAAEYQEHFELSEDVLSRPRAGTPTS